MKKPFIVLLLIALPLTGMDNFSDVFLATKAPLICDDQKAIKEVTVLNNTGKAIMVYATFMYKAKIIPIAAFTHVELREIESSVAIKTDPVEVPDNGYRTIIPKTRSKFWRNTWDQQHVIGIKEINSIRVPSQKNLYNLSLDQDGRLIVK